MPNGTICYGSSSTQEDDPKQPHDASITMVSGTSIMDIPTTILLDETFLKLPINAITRCEVVCKSWFNLLDLLSSNNASSFANVYSKNPPFTTVLLSEGHKRLSLLEISQDGTYECFRTCIYPKVPECLDANSDLYFIGSSKGLLCFSVCSSNATFKIQTVYISNVPITGECIALPPHSIPRTPNEELIVHHEFGFVPSTNNFKVVRLFHPSDVYSSLDVVYKVQIEIFTVGVDEQWRRCLEEPWVAPIWWGICTFNGALHWAGIDPADSKCALMYIFDLGKEKVSDQVIKCPPVIEITKKNRMTMLNNRFCLLITSFELMTIWTMNEYGVESSWTNDVILQSWFPSDLCIKKIHPLAVLPNGVKLFVHGEGKYLISYDPTKEKTVNIEVHDVKEIPRFIQTYAPSFSSLNELMMGGEGSYGTC